MCAIFIGQGRYAAADDLIWRIEAKLGPAARSAIVRIAAHNSHYMGNHRQAADFAEQALNANGPQKRGTRTSGVLFGQRLLALMVMAKTAWITGSTNRAFTILQELLEEAAEINHAVSSCLVISVGAVPMFHASGRLAEARKYLDRLHHVADTNSLWRWKEWADGYDLYGFDNSAGKCAEAISRELLSGGQGPRLENTAVIAGRRAPLEILDLAISGEAGWCRPELFRLKGQLLCRRGEDGRIWLKRGLDLAVQQEALLWQLRCATSLTEFETGAARTEAIRALEKILAAFPEPPPVLDYNAATEVLAA